MFRIHKPPLRFSVTIATRYIKTQQRLFRAPSVAQFYTSRSSPRCRPPHSPYPTSSPSSPLPNTPPTSAARPNPAASSSPPARSNPTTGTTESPSNTPSPHPPPPHPHPNLHPRLLHLHNLCQPQPLGLPPTPLSPSRSFFQLLLPPHPHLYSTLHPSLLNSRLPAIPFRNPTLAIYSEYLRSLLRRHRQLHHDHTLPHRRQHKHTEGRDVPAVVSQGI
jgi:hypothetical protein